MNFSPQSPPLPTDTALKILWAAILEDTRVRDLSLSNPKPAFYSLSASGPQEVFLRSCPKMGHHQRPPAYFLFSPLFCIGTLAKLSLIESLRSFL